MVRGRYRVGVSKTKTKEKIMMKKKVMPLSCLMAAAMLAGCGTAAPAVPEETTAPAVETAEAAQETAPADAAESEAAAVEKTAGVWQVEPCYNFDEIVPLYSEWDHTAGKNAAEATVTVTDGSATPDTPSVDTPSTDNKAAETSAAAAVSTAPVDTRTAQQREIDEAKANGTWGIEYTTCQKCGYHNWTRKGNVYVCDTCGNETTTVVSANGVKGYVGNGAIAPIANKSAAPETRYATAKQAQDAADAREAAYAAAVVAFQKQIAANEAAYLAAIAK